MKNNSAKAMEAKLKELKAEVKKNEAVIADLKTEIGQQGSRNTKTRNVKRTSCKEKSMN